jgi:hypothetical protein
MIQRAITNYETGKFGLDYKHRNPDLGIVDFVVSKYRTNENNVITYVAKKLNGDIFFAENTMDCERPDRFMGKACVKARKERINLHGYLEVK